MLSARRLNRALLARQLLLARTKLPLGRALERVGGLQAQYAPSPYLRLWSMLDRFERDDLTRALPRKSTTVWSGTWVPLVRVPPSGTWERRRADLFRLAAEWLPPEQVTEDEGLEHLLRRYLSAFGPSTLADAATWAGVKRGTLVPVAERIATRMFRDEDGRELLDLARAPLPREDTRAPARFLGHWDAVLLVHMRRTQILPERFRQVVFSTKTPQSMATFLVDGSVAGAWRVERTAQKATLQLEPFEPIPRAARDELRGEGEGLVRFHEPDAVSYRLRIDQ